MEADKRRRDAIIELVIRELLEMVYPVYNKEESVMDNLIRFVRDGGELKRGENPLLCQTFYYEASFMDRHARKTMDYLDLL